MSMTSFKRPGTTKWLGVRFVLVLGLLCGPLLNTSALAQNPNDLQLLLPRVQMKVGMYRIEAQVASTPRQREVGLMFRTSLPSYEGMLFVFEQATQQCFWMKNAPIPLSIAFLADDGRIVNLDEMQANTTTAHCSAQPVRYVLEMNRAWFSGKNIQAGARITGLPPAKEGSSER